MCIRDSLKLGLLALAGLAVVRSAVQLTRSSATVTFWTTTVLGSAAFVVAKSIYIGGVVGVPEHRYMLGGWSLVLVIAGVGLAHLTSSSASNPAPAAATERKGI